MQKIIPYRVIFILSLAFNVITIFYFLGKRFYYSHWAVFHNEISTNERWSRYVNDPPDSKEIVFIGTSLTRSFPLNSYFHNRHIKNLGFAGAPSSMILNDINKVFKRKPYKIFLECGINDLRYTIAADSIFVHLTKICAAIRAQSPNTILYVQSVFPTSYDILNSQIRAYNKRVETYCTENKINYVNLYNAFLKNDILDQHLTPDGIHLNDIGYFVWAKGVEGLVN